MFGFKKELYTPEYQLAGDECAVIETSKGTIKVKFDGEGAPIHVANFCELSTMARLCHSGRRPQYPRYVRRRRRCRS